MGNGLVSVVLFVCLYTCMYALDEEGERVWWYWALGIGLCMSRETD